MMRRLSLIFLFLYFLHFTCASESHEPLRITGNALLLLFESYVNKYPDLAHELYNNVRNDAHDHQCTSNIMDHIGHCITVLEMYDEDYDIHDSFQLIVLDHYNLLNLTYWQINFMRHLFYILFVHEINESN